MLSTDTDRVSVKIIVWIFFSDRMLTSFG